MINIGSNKFEQVAVPLIFEDRYFLLESTGAKDVWTVFTFVNGEPVIEIMKNVPQKNSLTEVTTNPAGIITVADLKTNNFLYKIRPGSKDSSIFGAIQGNEKEIKITDKEIRFGGIKASNNIIMGLPVGIIIKKDGSSAIGSTLPAEFRKLIK